MNSRTVPLVALYVSIPDRHNPEVQLAELREYAGAHNWAVGGEYSDPIGQGSRPALDRLLSALHKGQFDAVLVWRNSDGRPGLVLNPPRAPVASRDTPLSDGKAVPCSRGSVTIQSDVPHIRFSLNT